VHNLFVKRSRASLNLKIVLFAVNFHRLHESLKLLTSFLLYSKCVHFEFQIEARLSINLEFIYLYSLQKKLI